MSLEYSASHQFILVYKSVYQNTYQYTAEMLVTQLFVLVATKIFVYLS